jgi:predicted protein tyrosine phosphatase
MISIRVCSAVTVPQHWDFGARYMVSFLDPGVNADQVRPPNMAEVDHFTFRFADRDDASDPEGPHRTDVARLVGIGRQIASPESKAAILIHCGAGISRSPAAAFIFFCIHLGPGKEEEAFDRAERSREARGIWPNDLMVRYADEILGRQRSMIRTVIRRKSAF